MSSFGYYDPVIFLNILEILSGLLIVSTIIKRFQAIDKITKGGIFIMFSGTLIIGSSFYRLMFDADILIQNFLYTLVFISFSIGLLYFTKPVKIIRRVVKKPQKTTKR